MTSLIKLIEKISGFSGIVVAWLVLPLICATVFEVLARYVFNAPTIWSYELGYMAMGTHALMGAAFALREGAHIRIDVIFEQFSPKTKATLDLLGYLFLFFPLVILLNFGLWGYWTNALASGEGSGQSAWNPPIWPFRLCFFAGFFLLLLQGVAQLAKSILILQGDEQFVQSSKTDRSEL